VPFGGAMPVIHPQGPGPPRPGAQGGASDGGPAAAGFRVGSVWQGQPLACQCLPDLPHRFGGEDSRRLAERTQRCPADTEPSLVLSCQTRRKRRK
jgi:hypothetical protein